MNDRFETYTGEHIPPGEWYVYSWDYDKDGKLIVYVDGKPVPSNPCFCNPLEAFQDKCFDCIEKIYP